MLKLIIGGFLCLSTISTNCLGSHRDYVEEQNKQQERMLPEVPSRDFKEMLDDELKSFVDIYNLKISTTDEAKINENFLYNPFPIIGTDYIEKDKDGKNVIKQATEDDFCDLLKNFFPNLETLYVYTKKDLDFVLKNLEIEYVKNLKNGIRVTLNPNEGQIGFLKCIKLQQKLKKYNKKLILGDKQVNSILDVVLSLDFKGRLDYNSKFIAARYFKSFVDMYNLEISTPEAAKTNEQFFYNPFPIIGTDYVSKDKDTNGNNITKQATEDDFCDLLKKFFPNLQILCVYTKKDLDFVLKNLEKKDIKNPNNEDIKNPNNEYITNLKNGICVALNQNEEILTFSECIKLQQALKESNIKLILDTPVVLTQEEIKNKIGCKLVELENRFTSKHVCIFIDDLVTDLGSGAFQTEYLAEHENRIYVYAKNLKTLHEGSFRYLYIDLMIAPELQKIDKYCHLADSSCNPAFIFAPKLQEIHSDKSNFSKPGKLFLTANNLKIIQPAQPEQPEIWIKRKNNKLFYLNDYMIEHVGDNVLYETQNYIFNLSSLKQLNNIFAHDKQKEFECKYLIFRDLKCINSEEALSCLKKLEKIILIDDGSNLQTLKDIKKKIMENELYKDLPVIQNDNIVIMTQSEYDKWLNSDEGKVAREEIAKRHQLRNEFYAQFNDIERKINTNQEITAKELCDLFKQLMIKYNN